MSYLGFRVFPDQRRVSQVSIQRFNRRRRRWRFLAKYRMIDPAKIGESLQAWSAHVDHANSYGLRRDLMKKIRLRFRK